MKYEEILGNVKNGKFACREGWNEKGMFIFNFYNSVLCFGSDENFDAEYYDMSECNDVIKIGDDLEEKEMFKLEDFLLLKTAGNTAIPWTASQADMFADDWMIL